MQNATGPRLSIGRPSVPVLTTAERATRLAARQAWLQGVDLLDGFNRLVDLLPGLHVFVKNRHSEMVFLSRSMLDTFGLSDEEAIGLNDFDLTPTAMAVGYRTDDAALVASGQPLLNRMELWIDHQGLPEWYLVNKLPLRSKEGRIVGIIGFLQACPEHAKRLPLLPAIAKAVALMQENHSQALTVRQVARQVGLSPRQLERRFRSLFGLGPREFLVRTRVRAAARLLRVSDQSLAEVALACGFCDQSAFARSFHQHVGVTPTAFRRHVSPR